MPFQGRYMSFCRIHFLLYFVSQCQLKFFQIVTSALKTAVDDKLKWHIMFFRTFCALLEISIFKIVAMVGNSEKSTFKYYADKFIRLHFDMIGFYIGCHHF